MIRKRFIAAAAALAIAAGGASLAADGPAYAAGCTAQLGGSCGAYTATAQWPGSNGFNTYDSNQSFANSGSTQTMTAPDVSSPSSVPMSIQANDVPYGYTGVQTFPDVQQLTNNWSADGKWNGQDADLPVDALPSIVINYSETSPHGTNDIYEFAPDIWTSYAGQAGQGSGDIMFWADTSPVRCNDNGLSSSDIIGHVTLQGQNWTAYRYGGTGGEIVLILNTTSPDPVTTDTCAQQASGSIDIQGGLDWLNAQGLVPHPGGFTIGQINTGWEITSAQNSLFTLNSYTIDTGSGPSPTPTPTSPSPSPTPTPTETSPSPTPTPTPTGPAVAFDSQAGAGRVARTLSWSQNVSNATGRVMLAESTVGKKNDLNCTQKLRLNGLPMTKLGVIHTNNQHDGFMDVWKGTPVTGTNRFSMTTSGCGTPTLTAVSEAFSGVSSVGPLATQVGYSTSATGSATGDLVAAFAAAGSALEAPDGTHSLLVNRNDATGAGNSAGAVTTGSITWPITASDWWATGLVPLHA